MTREEFLIAMIPFGNVPYIYGGQDLNGMDCSGLAQLALAMLGLDPVGDQGSQALANHFRSPENGRILMPDENPDLGDLVFYGRSPLAIEHVDLCLGSGKVMGARGGGPQVTTRQIAESVNAKVKVRDFGMRTDIVYVIRPYGLPWAKGAKDGGAN